ncbi:universal stress protein [Desulfovermiculus halophilus]|jgi:nucleotide-binding universal stress UspA family protein|uniref:universal stress protein n=1 Tax=Desulfovermiculus halophilus TaxID=339722 RepID=UPI0004859582|nr:universal stress protein [Desulfovermiculus halophilus]
MFGHILVPTDCTPDTKKALDIAVKMQSLEKNSELNQRITLLHVIETIADDDAEEFERFYSTLTRRSENKMRELGAEYGAAQANIETKVLLGSRVGEILAFAQEQSVDLILLNSHRIDLENPTEGWGTISHKVGILAPCPVMLVK